jgi:hypothetical protein
VIIQSDEPIYIWRRTKTGKDAHGNPTYSKTSTLVRNALFAYAGTGEPVEVNADPIDVKLTLYLPQDTEVLEGDEFEIRGTRWVKDGDPEDWQQLWVGFTPGVVVQVRKRRG